MRDAAQRMREQAQTEWVADPIRGLSGAGTDVGTPVVGATGSPRSELTVTGLGFTAAEPAPWDLEIVDADALTVRIRPGTILAGDGTMAILDITDVTATLPVADGGWIGLQLAVDTEDPYDVTAELKWWGSWPLPDNRLVETTNVSGAPVLQRVIYPLYAVVSSADAPDDSVPIGGDLYAVRYAPRCHFTISDRPMWSAIGLIDAPWLEPAHRGGPPII